MAMNSQSSKVRYVWKASSHHAKLHDMLQALFNALRSNTVCTTLYTSGHAMSAAAAAALAELLQTNKTLKCLCVGDETFGSNIQELASGLGAKCALVRLDLENKGIGSDTVQDLACLTQALQHCTTLRELVLSRNSFGAHGLPAGWSQCKALSITHLAMSDCGLGGGMRADLQGAMPEQNALVCSPFLRLLACLLHWSQSWSQR